MEYQTIQQQFESLPPDAQTLVADFTAFLQRRYHQSSQAQQTKYDFRSDPFIGLWQEREDLEESSQWVRMTRAAQ